MKPSDLRIETIQVEFCAETLSMPLQLSQGMIAHRYPVSYLGERRRQVAGAASCGPL
jgi:hypothetical protein